LQKDRRARDKATVLLQRVGLLDRQRSLPHQLSGGEKQRCAMCRALINNPKILFADEPTGNLDSANTEALLSLLLELHAERQTTLLLATHNSEIARMANRTIILQDGAILQDTSRAP
jgi:putative ABC transport system ATP-binding protein